MNNRLIPCAQCARHVRSSESVCPFCEAPISPTTASPVVRTHPRWSRSQRLAAAAAVAGSLAGGCAETKTAPHDAELRTGGDATGGDASGGTPATGGVTSGGTLNDTGGIIIPPYGIPATGSVFGPPPTGGSDTSGMDAGIDDNDAGSPQPETGGEIYFPIYGAPIPER